MIRDLVLVPARILTTVARSADAADPVEEIVRDLWDTCRAHGGLGLAAPQIGVGARVAVVEPNIVLINPTVVRTGRDIGEMVEGCLSMPGRTYMVRRRRLVTVSCLVPGHAHRPTYDLSGMQARAAQHEMDHLDGVLLSVRALVLDP